MTPATERRQGLAPVAQLGHPVPGWAVVATAAGKVGLRVAERRIVTGMLDLMPDDARELAQALERVAHDVETSSAARSASTTS